MKTKTQDLTGPALDWAVLTLEQSGDAAWYLDHKGRLMEEHGDVSWVYSPSTDWAQGGPIIEREGISIIPFDATRWEARCAVAVQRTPARFVERRGPTPLVAAMRCYVASKLGDTVDIPEELL